MRTVDGATWLAGLASQAARTGRLLRDAFQIRSHLGEALARPERLANLGLSQAAWGRRSTTAGSAPQVLMVESTDRCNLRCPQCPRTTIAPVGGTDLPFEVFRGLMEEVGPRVLVVGLWLWGEPLLHQRLPEMVEEARRCGALTAVTTNALLLTEELVDRLMEAGLTYLCFSAETGGEESYGTFRPGGTFDEFVERVGSACARRGQRGRELPLTELRLTRVREGEAQEAADQALAARLGVDRLTYQELRTAHNADLNKHLRSGAAGGRAEVGQMSARPGCSRVWTTACVTAGGAIVPCPDDLRKEIVLGDLSAGQAMSDIWNGAAYRSFRGLLRDEWQPLGICRACSGRGMSLRTESAGA